MVDIVINEIKSKLDVCVFYEGYLKKLDEELQKHYTDKEKNFYKRIKEGTCSPDEFLKIRKDFYLLSMGKEDLKRHLMSLGAAYDLANILLKIKEKSITDYFNEAELIILNSAVNAGLTLTAKDGANMVFKDKALEDAVMEKIESDNTEQYERIKSAKID